MLECPVEGDLVVEFESGTEKHVDEEVLGQ